jgi:hypothetical protein
MLPPARQISTFPPLLSSRTTVANTEHYMASSSQLEQRVANLEAEVATLKRKLDKLGRTIPWWEQIAATFESDPIHEKAMQLGREYRQSLRPKTTPCHKQ